MLQVRGTQENSLAVVLYVHTIQWVHSTNVRIHIYNSIPVNCYLISLPVKDIRNTSEMILRDMFITAVLKVCELMIWICVKKILIKDERTFQTFEYSKIFDYEEYYR